MELISNLKENVSGKFERRFCLSFPQNVGSGFDHGDIPWSALNSVFKARIIVGFENSSHFPMAMLTHWHSSAHTRIFLVHSNWA